MTQQLSVPECLGESRRHSTEWSILEEKPSVHGTTTLFVSGIHDSADDTSSVAMYRKLETVKVVVNVTITEEEH